MDRLRYLIVNADDMGMTKGITDGILESHTKGIVTSASLMVDMPASKYAVKRLLKYEKLSLGLHGVLNEFGGGKSDISPLIKLLEIQLRKFIELVGKNPTHFDLHAVPPTTPMMAFASFLFTQRYDIPTRGSLNINVVSYYYGLRNGKSSFDKISVNSLNDIIKNLPKKISLLVCHPGFTSNKLKDPYRIYRNVEVKTLTSNKIYTLINEEKVELINFNSKEVREFYERQKKKKNKKKIY